jgi:hypothetical protein
LQFEQTEKFRETDRERERVGGREGRERERRRERERCCPLPLANRADISPQLFEKEHSRHTCM